MSKPLIRTWGAYMRAQSLSTRTINERLGTVTRFESESADIETATHLDVALWLGNLDVSATSRATYHGHLKACFEWLKIVDLRTDSPMDKVPKPRRPRCTPRPVDSSAIPKILKACSRKRTRMMVLLATFAGLRVHEIAKVRAEDFDLTTGSLYVDGKGGVRAMIPVHHMIAAELVHFPREGYLFPGSDSGHVLSNSVSMLIGRAMKRAGVAGTAHQLRHWYGTSLLESGTDVRVVQELMRHVSIQSTTIYTRVSDTMRRDAIDRLAA